MSVVNVALYASDPITRLGVAGLIASEPRLSLVDTAAGPAGAVDVVVVAVDLVDSSALKELEDLPVTDGVRMCLIVGNGWRVDPLALVRLGVRAVLWRSGLTPTKFAEAVISVHRGAGDFPTSLQGGLLNRIQFVQEHVLRPQGLTASGFTNREIDVLRLASEGLGLVEISNKLCYSERTVKNILYSLMKRLNLKNRVHLVAYAIREGII
ncbi:response regulator transcription factor [Streptomyces sp. DSM 41524]|uniref:Response regulator transcription factor n=1 Tax=Streptomyces asiaticus subsp. ignotus TaxID=3098222 RepID=A0ABU7Q712_9ACTN|nr:response regulator transcription factor [Streptomyces sp. DSM 41524]